jgi:arsenate reductase
MKTVIFACIHNAGRSQMAAAWTNPGARVHPEVLQAMREVGIDLEGATPRKLTDELAAEASILITMGCGEQCPHVPGLRHLDWPLEDPKGKPVERVREIREEVKGRVQDLVRTEAWQ